MSKDFDSDFRRTAEALPDEWILAGVTFHGPDARHRWVAFTTDASGNEFGPEGWGDTAPAAMQDLITKAAEFSKPVAIPAVGLVVTDEMVTALIDADRERR